MPSKSESTEPTDRAEVESPTANVTVLDCAREETSSHPVYVAGPGSSTPLKTRIRVVALKTAVALLEQERDELRKQVADLEDERSSLRETVERKDQQFQQVVDNYEAVIAAKNREHRELIGEYEEKSSQSGSLPVPAPSFLSGVAKSVKRIITRW